MGGKRGIGRKAGGGPGMGVFVFETALFDFITPVADAYKRRGDGLAAIWDQAPMSAINDPPMA